MNELSSDEDLSPYSSASRRNLLLGIGGSSLLAAGLAASNAGSAEAQTSEGLSTQDLSLSQA